MMTTGTGATALEDMEAGITESLVERNGTEGAVQSAGGQTAHGIKQTMTEGVCRQDTAAENAIGIEMRQVHPPQTDTGNTFAIAQAVERESADVWRRRKRGEQTAPQAVERDR